MGKILSQSYWGFAPTANVQGPNRDVENAQFYDFLESTGSFFVVGRISGSWGGRGLLRKSSAAGGKWINLDHRVTDFTQVDQILESTVSPGTFYALTRIPGANTRSGSLVKTSDEFETYETLYVFDQYNDGLFTDIAMDSSGNFLAGDRLG
jgi:hypothetical protein